MKVAFYLRVSTDDKGHTVESERLALQEFCRAQGWTDAAEYADEASATDLRGRKTWHRLLDDAAKRKARVQPLWGLMGMVRWLKRLSWRHGRGSQ